MREQEKKRWRIYDLLNADTNQKKFPKKIGVSLFSVYKTNKDFFLQKKSFLGEKGEWGIERKNKKIAF